MPAKKSPTEELIREIAHKLWVDEGMPDGNADSHWFRAIEIASTEKKVAAKKPAAKTAAAKKSPAPKKPAAAKAVAKAPAKATSKAA